LSEIHNQLFVAEYFAKNKTKQKTKQYISSMFLNIKWMLL